MYLTRVSCHPWQNDDSGGIRTLASERLVPKTSALDHSATLPPFSHFCPFCPFPR